MGAFFLFPADRQGLDLQALEQDFGRRGFDHPVKVRQRNLELWLWPKQRLPGVRCLREGERCVAFVVGTMVYRRGAPAESLRMLAEDYRCRRISWDELFGSFCAGFWEGEKLQLLTDRLECQPVFVDEQREVASSSFLGLLAALPGRQRLNRLGLAEKLATGYVVGPDTLVAGIHRTTGRMQADWNGGQWGFVRKPPRVFTEAEGDREGAGCLQVQLDALDGYLRSIRALAGQHPAVLGLSTGYDSRLLFAAACRAGFPLAVQTHATVGVHDFDLAVVRDLAGKKGVRLVVVPTRPMRALSPAEFAAVARGCVAFFDGRCSHNMGAFSETYTREYSLASLGEYRLRLNGLGGELYRNYYFDSPRPVDFRAWLQRHVYYPTARRVITDTGLWEEMHRNKVAKMSEELGLDLSGAVSALARKRYYCEIRMPQCDGANHNAHNQVAFYLTPFIEWPIIRTGYRAVPFLGSSGRFQADLIAAADPEVARAPSHYGFELTREPPRHRLKSWLKSTLPDSFWVVRRDRQIARDLYGADSLRQFEGLRERFPALREIEEAQSTFAPGFNWRQAQRDYAQGPTALFLGAWLGDYAHKLHPW